MLFVEHFKKQQICLWLMFEIDKTHLESLKHFVQGKQFLLTQTDRRSAEQLQLIKKIMT